LVEGLFDFSASSRVECKTKTPQSDFRTLEYTVSANAVDWRLEALAETTVSTTYSPGYPQPSETFGASAPLKQLLNLELLLAIRLAAAAVMHLKNARFHLQRNSTREEAATTVRIV
jgi:hypothetical protein